MNPDYEIIFKFSNWFFAKNLREDIKHKYFIGKEVELGVYRTVKWIGKR